MRLSSILPGLLLLPALAGAQTNFTIKGKVGQLNEPVKAYLRYAVDGKQVTDSAVLAHGTFEFKGTVKEPMMAMVSLYYGPDASRFVNSTERAKLYLENGTISIESADSIKNATVKGGIVNTENAELSAMMKPLEKRNADLMALWMSKSESERKDSVFYAGVMATNDAIMKDQKEILRKFITSKPKSVLGLEALKEYAGSFPDYQEVQPLFKSLAADVQKSEQGVKYADRLEKVKAVAIGAVAPDFTQNDPEGKPVSLASFRGKYVLIDFWASWCGPCRAENPAVVKAYNEYKDRNFTILGVSLDQEGAHAKWVEAIKADNLTWTQVSDLAFWKNAVAQQYAVNSIPQNFLLDPNGKIIAKNLRGKTLEAKLAEVIK
ncbi:redoxin domain-containing protein [Chitinophaga sp. SYP-B3965]|uniref:TlpA disulfide reductase family protein n=1 Tax=Chitinophaga sp. SYP-B3965 TaxID=2663120 RepID=UPI0012995434|nr:TlpA disulfide reductase family protein [Chitinophaga sp. SYP-B3965]MRG47195.1 redoxin domain-containing protein [Chitinophaga sp. SYP-B3965]